MASKTSTMRGSTTGRVACKSRSRSSEVYESSATAARGPSLCEPRELFLDRVNAIPSLAC